MLSSLFVTSIGCDVLVEKQCSDKVPRQVLEEYWQACVASSRSLTLVPAVAHIGRFCVVHQSVNDVMLLAVCAAEAPPMLAIEFLASLQTVLEAYLREVRTDTVREHFSLVYQLLEEMIDNGVPLTTDVGPLEVLVPRPTLENKVRSIIDAPSKKGRGGHEGQVPWRANGISYSTNEIFFDLTDFLDVTINADGKVVRAEVRGELTANCKLSGMPDVLLRLAGTENFDDVSLHKCVRFGRYENDRSLNFVPPDGNFTLMRYRAKPLHSFHPAFYLTPQVSFNKSGGRISVICGMKHNTMHVKEEERNVHKLTVTIPLPPHTDAVNISACSQGTCTYDPLRKQVVWKVGHLGATTPSLSGDILFKPNTTDVTDGASENVLVEFQIPNYSASTTRVTSVSIQNEGYKPFKGVKYMTRGGRYVVRTS